MDSSFRPLTGYERALLQKLLEPAFPGRDELRSQMSSVTAKQVEDDGTLVLRCDPEPRAPVKIGMVAEGWCTDTDGVMIEVLLHVKNGLMRMLEIIKVDGSRIQKPPVPAELELFTPYGEAGVWSPPWPKGDCG